MYLYCMLALSVGQLGAKGVHSHQSMTSPPGPELLRGSAVRFKCLQAGASFGIPHRYKGASQNGQKWVAVRGETGDADRANLGMMEM